MTHTPRFPLYIPSKGRAAHLRYYTSRALTRMGLEHTIVVEPQEESIYREAIHEAGLLAEILVLDLAYKEKYQLLDKHGLSKSTGSGPARNFIWDHAVANGHAWHWIIDDNIKAFYRFNRNLKVPTNTPAFFAAMEDFALRYKNVAMAGPQYEMFVLRKEHHRYPFVLNTRIYSCNLIRNDAPFRWRGRYNEDTILSLDMLKAGWCTILFMAFLQVKLVTRKLPGGNTAELYRNGTLAKSQMLVDTHPDITKLVWRYKRWHHQVDYRPFERQKLVRRDDLEIPGQPYEYGMKLVHLAGEAA
jgi:TET-associated glycosyltransferase-like protein